MVLTTLNGLQKFLFRKHTLYLFVLGVLLNVHVK